MKCKSCGRIIEDNSLFCNWCGTSQIKQKKSKDEIKVPKPIKRGNRWTLQLRAEGVCFTENTAGECITKAKAYRAGYIEKKNIQKQSVKTVIDKFLTDNSNILSPATMRAYKSYQRNHFTKLENQDINEVQWQIFVNDLTAKKKPKTVVNIWRLVTGAMRYSDINPPSIKLPDIPVPDEPFLTFDEIEIFLKAIKGTNIEIPALLALHSLRRSEILALTPESIDRKNKVIHVRGARVEGEKSRLVLKETNKNKASTRDVPIMIDRLLELIPENGNDYLVQMNQATLERRINRICRNAGLPDVAVHGLRRSFASLAYHLKWSERITMQVGGWSNPQTVHRFYIKLSASDVNANTQEMKDFYNRVGG